MHLFTHNILKCWIRKVYLIQSVAVGKYYNNVIYSGDDCGDFVDRKLQNVDLLGLCLIKVIICSNCHLTHMQFLKYFKVNDKNPNLNYNFLSMIYRSWSYIWLKLKRIYILSKNLFKLAHFDLCSDLYIHSSTFFWRDEFKFFILLF